MPEETLQSAVESAVTQETPEPVSQETPAETVETVETKPEQPVEPPVEENRPSQEEINKALNVYKALNDPNAGPQLVKMLAEQLGITQKEVKQELKQPGAIDFLKGALGPDYEFLAPKLATGIEGYIQSVLNPLQENIQRNRAEFEYNTAISTLQDQTKGDFQKHQDGILKLMDVVKPAPGVSTRQYLETLYKMAKAEKPVPPASVATKVVERMTKNAQENLPSPSAATENRIVKGPALPSVADAVMAALRGERFE